MSKDEAKGKRRRRGEVIGEWKIISEMWKVKSFNPYIHEERKGNVTM